MAFKEYLGDKTFYKKVALISIPISLQGLINIGVNMMDTIMLGQLGEVGLSASSLANQFISIFQYFTHGCTIIFLIRLRTQRVYSRSF